MTKRVPTKRQLDQAIARDGRLTRSEMRAKQRVDQHYRWLRWYEKKQRATAYERAVKRDGKLNSEERRALRPIRKNHQVRRCHKLYADRYVDSRRRSVMRRYAMKRGAAGDASPEQIRMRWEYYGNRCWMCRAPATETDHVIPLSRGGSDWPSNQRPACQRCNRAKWNKLLSELNPRTPI